MAQSSRATEKNSSPQPALPLFYSPPYDPGVNLVDRLVSFFIDNFPPAEAILAGAPAGLIWAMACLLLAGYLKRSRGWKTGYTRKVFHFLIFFSVALIQRVWGTPLVCLFGGMTSLVLLYALIRGSGDILYEALAREKDAPLRTYFIVAPYLATLIGGLVSNILWGPLAAVGYLVTGLGDAVGEPVGTRFGKHTYRIPSLGRVKAVRSLEGSAAVFLCCTLAIWIGAHLLPQLHLSQDAWFKLPLLGLACSLVEAASPHGWDNATLQIVPTALAHYYL